MPSFEMCVKIMKFCPTLKRFKTQELIIQKVFVSVNHRKNNFIRKLRKNTFAWLMTV